MSTVSQSSQIKKAIRLCFIQTQTKLRKKRNPKNQEKLYLQRIKDTSNKSHKFWNTIEKPCPTKSKSSKFTTTFRTIDEKILTEKQSIADGFCKFFSSAANRLKKTTFPLTEITCRTKPTKVSFTTRSTCYKLFFNKCSCTKRFQKSKSCTSIQVKRA